MKQKPTILILENSVHVTGALKSITRTAYDLTSFFDFNFVIPTKSHGRFWIENKGFACIAEIPLLELSRKISAVFLYLPRLATNSIRIKRILEDQKIDLIHVNDIYNLLPISICLLGNKTPYVCHVRFMPDRFPKLLLTFWLKLHFRFASKIVAVSESVKKRLPPHPKIVVIHNELPVGDRYPNMLNDSQLKSTYTFLYLSNFINGKGQAFALKAFSKIHASLPDWKLRFVGGDMGLEKNRKYRDELMMMGERLEISHKLEWRRFTDEVELEYKKADIILNFSESESFSLSCLEALYFGRPLIASDCGGPAEIIDHQKTGILVQNRNVEEMADAMLELATNKPLREKLGSTARITVKEKFSIQNTSLKLKEVYDSALSKQSFNTR